MSTGWASCPFLHSVAWHMMWTVHCKSFCLVQLCGGFTVGQGAIRRLCVVQHMALLCRRQLCGSRVPIDIPRPVPALGWETTGVGCIVGCHVGV